MEQTKIEQYTRMLQKSSKSAINQRTTRRTTNHGLLRNLKTSQKRKIDISNIYGFSNTQKSREISRNRVNSKVREIKEEYWQKFSIEIEVNKCGAEKRISKVLRGMNRSTNKPI